MRKSVDLPQPDGPTITTNSPSATVGRHAMDDLELAVILANVAERYGGHRAISPFDEALDEPALHQHDDGGRRQQREHRGGHDEVPFVARIAADDHPLDADHRRVHRLLACDQQRPEVLVPAVDELDHEQRSDARLRKWQHDVPEEAHRSRAVDARGLGELLGIVRKNCRNRNVAVADAISGSVSPAYESSIPRSATTLNVGMIRTPPAAST
jgi:hypothetical protein